MQVCLIMYDLLIDSRHQRVNKQITKSKCSEEFCSSQKATRDGVFY